MPVRPPYKDIIEVQLAENNGILAQFGPGKTIVTFQCVKREETIRKKQSRHARGLVE